MAVSSQKFRETHSIENSYLRQSISPSDLGCRLLSEVDPLDLPPGQHRAIAAIKFSTEMDHAGYNCFLLGLPGSGRKSTALKLLNARAKDESAPTDWVYVYNFESPRHPIALELPAGCAAPFQQSMDDLIEDLQSSIPEIFKSDEYAEKRRSLDIEYEELQANALEELREKANKQEVAIIRTPMGFTLAPTNEGQVIKPESFNELPEKQKNEIEAKIAHYQSELTQVLTNMPKIQREHRMKVRELNAKMSGIVVDASIELVAKRFNEFEAIQNRLIDVRRDMIANTELFLSTQRTDEEAALPTAAPLLRKDPTFNRYRVNVMICNDGDGDKRGAPVVVEEHPTLARLIGRIEHYAQYGALITDFTMIRPGALHNANGGYLIIDARKILQEPFAWEALNRTLKGQEINIVSAADEMGITSTTSLEPAPIALKTKVVLIGDRRLYYLLCSYDPEFSSHFKVQADFDDELDRSNNNIIEYLGLLASIRTNENLLDFDAKATARILDEAVRMASDSDKLTLKIEQLKDLMRQANHMAKKRNAKRVAFPDVTNAIEAQVFRADRIRQKNYEDISRNILLIDVDGEKTGQVNGLSVLDLGNFRFGKPSRITARVRTGTGKVVDIERETELGGAIHSKGVLILSSFLVTQFSRNMPLSLWASIVFEQSYGGVDGDSASSAELYALLSALSDVPINQSYAVTGSVNQMGEIQAIGGVNEKIEGFFDICTAKGLTGKQGVLIPNSNIKHLMLRPDVVDACKKGLFDVYAIDTIETGIEILTGVAAGKRDKAGKFPEGSVFERVENRLHEYALARKNFSEVMRNETIEMPVSP